MKCANRGTRSRWVGPPVPAPKSKLSRSPSGRQRHYGAVELAGAGEQVNVNDVVEVAEDEQHQETSQRHPVLVQVLSMWEDIFTGVFKFRARWLVEGSDLPADALPRLRTTRQASTADRNAAGSKTPPNKDQPEADEVFLTKRVKDLEVRSIVKPITLCVSTSTTTEVSPERKRKMGPRLTHAFCEASGEFQPLEGTDPILKRARVRQANAVALASRADQESEAAKSGKHIAKSNGWLLPKRGAFERTGGRTAARGAGRAIEVVKSSAIGTGSCPGSSSPSMNIEETSDDSGTEEPPNSEDGEWKEGEEGQDDNATDTDSDSPTKSNPTLSVGEGFTQRKSARQRKSQRSPTLDADVPPTLTSEVEDCSGAKPEAVVSPPPPATTLTFQRRRRLPFKKRQGQLPPRPRRLAMPPMAEEPLMADVCEAAPLADTTSSVAVKVARPVRTRMSLGLRPKPSLALPRSASMEDVVKATPQLSIPAKRKRSAANRTTAAANRSDYPPLHALVGKDYQTDIPDLLSAEERKRPHTGTGAKMLWRSVQDWDPQSRRMLASYLYAAKEVVEAKQARPGVAVHVRLGGKKGSSGADKDDSSEIANSYAVWAVSSGREACELVRVACSEMAQTDIPRSAIQRVQSQEQALAALVKARCVLDNVEPALKMLADDHALPDSIEPWTLKQVRTLENALVKEYDPSRRLHGWARPGMEMDREDFIDLAKVSEEVPGKTPAQVLSFYYRYLAAAEPLTDVVYGPEAAKARKQEPISPASSASEPDVILRGSGRLPPGNANTTPKPPAEEVSPGLCSASQGSGIASEPASKPKPRVIRLSAPKPVESFVATTEPIDGPLVDSVQTDLGSTKRMPSPPIRDAVWSAPETASTFRSPPPSNRATTEATSGGEDRPFDADRRMGRAVDRQGDEGGGLGRASEFFAEQKRCAVREREVSRTVAPLPPDAEVLEVEDSDDGDEVGATGDSARSASSGVPGAGERTRPSDMEVAARHMNSMGPAGLSWVAKQMRRQAPPAVAPESRPRGVLPMAPRPVPRKSDRMEELRGGSLDGAWYGYRSEATGFPNTQGEARWEHSPPSRSIRHEQHGRRFDDRQSGGHVESGPVASSGFSGPGYGGRRTVQVESEPASRDDMFGSMAPCWRLLERAQAYMDKDQLEYMKGLILTHVRKPMSRDQLLERAESCLQEQDKIFAAFVKMFDRIDQPPQVPLYPAKRALRHRSQSMSYNGRRSSEADPIHASPHALPPPQMPPRRIVKAEGVGPYSSSPVDDGGEDGVQMTTPSQPHPRVGIIPVSGRVGIRRSIHPYDPTGVDGWRAGGDGSTGRNDAMGIRAEPSPRGISPGLHPLDPSPHPAEYPSRRYGTGHDGGGSVRNVWLQQPPGEWETETGPSTAAAAAGAATPSPGSIPWRGSTGPAWGDDGGGAWS